MKRKRSGIKANSKFAFILFAFLAVIVLILGRVVYFKTVKGEEYEAAAKTQQINRYDSVLTPDRGTILDRNDQVLAISTAVYNVVLDPLVLAEVDVKEQEKTITTLCEYFPELEYATLKNYIALNPETGTINLANHWKYLTKGIERELKEELEDLNLKGVYYEQTSKRSYPLKALACDLIGFTRGDTQHGIEEYYNDYMVGTPGRSFILYQEGDRVTYQDYEAQDGDTVIMTLDYTIQQFAEDVVNETQAKWHSQNTAAVVMDPNTGEILAMAETDSYDLNTPGTPSASSDSAFQEAWEGMEDENQMDYLNKMWTNFSVSSAYEPGSVYKPLVVAAALEEGVITKDSTFYCGGHMEIGGRTIGCHLTSGHGTINVEEIMAQSCNMGMIQIAQKLGSEKFYQYQKDFGTGELTGVDLPGDVRGEMHAQESIHSTELATMSFGQTFTSTTLQTLTAFSSLINGGNIIQPHAVSQIIDKDGNIVLENKPTVQRQVISQQTSDYIRTALKATVERGTGKKIQIEGYSIGCKTGTAEQGPRTRDDLWALTHIAYFPAENPQYIVMTVMYLPDGGTNDGQSTAGMTKALIEKIIKYKNMEPTEGDAQTNGITSKQAVTVPNYIGSSTYNVVGDLDARELNYKVVGSGNTITNQVPKEGAKVDKGSEIILYVEKSQEDSGTVTVPDVVGLTYTAARDKLADAGFEMIFEGETTGVVASQTPKYGVSVDSGSEIKIVLQAPETTSDPAA